MIEQAMVRARRVASNWNACDPLTSIPPDALREIVEAALEGERTAAQEVVDELVRVLGFCAAATAETNAMKFAAIDAAGKWRS